MVVSKLMDYLAKWRLDGNTALSDSADSLSSTWTILLTLSCLTIVSMKSYILTPITCHSPITYSGFNLASFVDNYCWVEGSVAIDDKSLIDHFPNTHDEWEKVSKKAKMTYYPWVPLFFGSLAIIPTVITTAWQIFYKKGTGSDLQGILDLAMESHLQHGVERAQTVEKITNAIVDNINIHREYRTGHLSQLKFRFFHLLGYGFFSKRFASWLNFTYFLVKFSYMCNHFGSLVAIHFFLGLDDDYRFFGVKVVSDILHGKSWKQTSIFPRVTYCLVPIRHNRVSFIYAQCAVPVNLLNEAIFIILWFWHVFAILPIFLSLLVWLYRTISPADQRRFLRKYLILSSNITVNDRCEKLEKQVTAFARYFLQHDGIFLLRMLSSLAGSRLTSDVVSSLWDVFRNFDDGYSKPCHNRACECLPDHS